MVTAPTVIAALTRAGEVPEASSLSLPAATVVVTPELMRLTMALSRVEETLPPKLKVATAGPLPLLLATQLIPETISVMAPEPLSLRTLTATTRAFFATPLYRSQHHEKTKKSLYALGARDSGSGSVGSMAVSVSVLGSNQLVVERVNVGDHSRHSHLSRSINTGQKFLVSIRNSIAPLSRYVGGGVSLLVRHPKLTK